MKNGESLDGWVTVGWFGNFQLKMRCIGRIPDTFDDIVYQKVLDSHEYQTSSYVAKERLFGNSGQLGLGVPTNVVRRKKELTPTIRTDWTFSNEPVPQLFFSPLPRFHCHSRTICSLPPLPADPVFSAFSALRKRPFSRTRATKKAAMKLSAHDERACESARRSDIEKTMKRELKEGRNDLADEEEKGHEEGIGGNGGSRRERKWGNWWKRLEAWGTVAEMST